MQNRQLVFIPWRFYLLLSFIMLAVLGLSIRLTDLAIFKQSFLRAEGDERALRLVSHRVFRGMMVDRNGYPLAVSALVYTIWANPHRFDVDASQEAMLQQTLHLSPQKWQLLHNSHKKFIYLQRDLPPDTAEKIQALAIPGVYLQAAFRRYYPEGDTTAHLLGWTNVDDQGQEGLELVYNALLTGKPGQKWVVKDRLGGTIADVNTVHHEQLGQDLTLSIDRRIQYIAYRELSNSVKSNAAASGTALVINVKTGEVLAIVNAPSFNPNDRPIAVKGAERNRAITDTFEPGSVIKAFTIASALESGRYQPDSSVDTSPGWMRVGNSIIRDEKNNGVLSLAKILQYSSNMGASKIALNLPQGELWNVLHRAGFGELTGIHFPGEQAGLLVKPHASDPATLAALSYGYGLSVTALQLAQAYMIFANQGIKYPLTLVKQTKAPQGVRVFDAKIAQEVLTLLEATFSKGGTAQTISIPGYRIAGKTGTAWLHGPTGYEKHRYNSSFVGIAPVSDPQLMVVVTIHDPRSKQYLAGLVAGPVFQKIMAQALRMLDIPPDAPQ